MPDAVGVYDPKADLPGEEVIQVVLRSVSRPDEHMGFDGEPTSIFTHFSS